MATPNSTRLNGITTELVAATLIDENGNPYSASGGSSITGYATEAKQDTLNTAINNILGQIQNNRMFQESVWKDATDTFYIRRTIYNPNTQTYTTIYILPDDSVYVPIAPSTLAVSNADLEFRSIEYVATTGGTGYSINDYVLRSDIFDISVSPATLQSTIWFNQTTGQVITPAPTQAHLSLFGDKEEITAINNMSAKFASGTTIGDVNSAQKGTWNINNISGTVSLPTGAASETTLSGVKTKTDNIDILLSLLRDAIVGTTNKRSLYDIEYQLKNNTFAASHLSAFGDITVVNPTPVIQMDGVNGLNTQIVTSTTANGGTVDTNAGRFRTQSGTTSNGSAILQSLDPARYRAGEGMDARFTYAWANNAANNRHYVGVGNAIDGYFFGHSGTTFGICHRNNSSDTFIAQASWNGDKCNGTGLSGFDWIKSNGSPMRIVYPFLGYGTIKFFVEHPSGYWILCHTIQYPNTSASIQITNPNLFAWIENINSGNTTNVTGYSGSFAIFISGKREYLGAKGGLKNNKAITTGTGQNIITIKNATNYNGNPNRATIRFSSIGCAFGNLANNAFGYVTLVKNATLGGTPSYTPYNGTTGDNGISITSGQSVISSDVAGTTVTGGINVWNSNGALTNNTFLDVTQLDLHLEPGATYTFMGEVTANASISVAFNWIEDI